MRPHDTTMPHDVTDEAIARIIADAGSDIDEWTLTVGWDALDERGRNIFLATARAVRAALEGNGLAGQWVAWQFDASHHGIVLEHDHTRNAVKIAHNGDSAATYWLAADQVYVVEEAQNETEVVKTG